jgi:hypothetical protein
MGREGFDEFDEAESESEAKEKYGIGQDLRKRNCQMK